MKGTFKDGLTATDLKAMGIKLSPTQFDSSLHFDISVTGDRVEILQRQEIFFNVVNFNLKAAGLSFILRLEYAELCNPMYAIQKKMQPADFKKIIRQSLTGSWKTLERTSRRSGRAL